MVEKEPEVMKIFDRSITRRQAIKAGGIAVVGLAFAKPAIDTFLPKPAFAQYVQLGNPSIRWRCPDGLNMPADTPIAVCPPASANPEDPDPGDDLEFTRDMNQDTVYPVTALLCDNSTPQALSYDVELEFLGVKAGFPTVNFNGLMVDGATVFAGDKVDVGSFTFQNQCISVDFSIDINGTGEKVKLQFVASPKGQNKMADLTLTLE